MKIKVLLLAISLGAGLCSQAKEMGITGNYLEVRTCDVYTGPCFANAEMGLAGKEGMLVWSVGTGAWRGTVLDGLSVIAVVRTDATLGNLKYHPRAGKAVLIVDARANAKQKEALADFARAMAGGLLKEIVAVKSAPMEVAMGTCSKTGCARVKVEGMVEITTRCLGDKDHACGNEEMFYPPLIDVTGAYPAFTEVAAFKGSELDLTWQATDQRSAFLATFSR